MKKALITGISGQDGAFLAQLLLKNGYRVFGFTRNRASCWRLEELGLIPRITLFEVDFHHLKDLYGALEQIQPNEIYNLAAQSSVAKSFLEPMETIWVDGFWMAHLLEWIRIHSKETRLFQAGSGEIFGTSKTFPQSEESPLFPCTPYSSAKVFAHNLVKNYRDIYGLYCVNGILFNHDSELRGMDFFTRRVSSHVAAHHLGQHHILEVGNIDVERDIGYAGEFVEAMYLSLQVKDPTDYIIATGISHPIRNFITECFRTIKINILWEGNSLGLKGLDSSTGELLVQVNPKNFRYVDAPKQLGDISRAEKILGWKAKTSFAEVAKIMVEKDINILSKAG